MKISFQILFLSSLLILNTNARAEDAAAPATAEAPTTASAKAETVNTSPVDAPSGESALKVIDYYYKGASQGPLLIKAELCSKLETEKGPNQYTCLEAAGSSAKKGAKISAILTFLVPADGSYDDVSVQFLNEGTVRSTKDIKLKGSFRYRTWVTEVLSKPGKWEVKVTRGGKDLHSDTITVQ